MPTVCAIHASPVKSLRLATLDRALLAHDGIEHDREFVLLDEHGRVATQRTLGMLAQIASRFDDGLLELELPSGDRVGGEPAAGGRARSELWGRPIEGHMVDGPWNRVLSDAAMRPLRLMRVTSSGRGLDSHPVSMLSAGAVRGLAAHAGRNGELDHRRFRPTFLIEGCEPNAEDAWVGRQVRLGEAVVSVIRLDPRCALTTRHPLTGERDADTLRWIAETRPQPGGAICFGVYADVSSPGTVCVGDSVDLL